MDILGVGTNQQYSFLCTKGTLIKCLDYTGYFTSTPLFMITILTMSWSGWLPMMRYMPEGGVVGVRHVDMVQVQH